ncbi:threonylcarbamoyl-AMP synthase [bacterium]|nr:threonylcarbamoyl-AMP synthase [bacterium]
MKTVNIKQLIEDKELLESFCNDMLTGSVAAIPTDTLYGFAAAANNESAVDKIYKIKGRNFAKPLILFIDNFNELTKMGLNTDDNTDQILKKNWPGALTAILPAKTNPQISAFKFETIGIRIPNHKMLLELLKKIPFKILTTSANRSGSISENDPLKIQNEFFNEIDWLIEDGIIQDSLPSTVADFSVSPFKILRQGKITL